MVRVVDVRPELPAMVAAAAGDVGVLAAMIALREAERGRPGRRWGVLLPGPDGKPQDHTLEEEAAIVARSFRNHEKRIAGDPDIPAIRDGQGFYSPEFLASFSRRWAPVGADNDPKGLNVHHVRNLVIAHGRVTETLLETLDGLCRRAVVS